MCFTRKQQKRKQQKIKHKYKKNKIHPTNDTYDIKNMTISEIGDAICNELLFCSHCKKHYPSEEFKMNCNGCDKLFHCGTAGRCIGKNCNIKMLNGSEYRMPYCLHCVDLKLDINCDNTDNCICKTCQ